MKTVVLKSDVKASAIYALKSGVNVHTVKTQLKEHQQGKTDYFTFCKSCAETGIEKWVVSLIDMTCIYYDKIGNKILVEQIPQP